MLEHVIRLTLVIPSERLRFYITRSIFVPSKR